MKEFSFVTVFGVALSLSLGIESVALALEPRQARPLPAGSYVRASFNSRSARAADGSKAKVTAQSFREVSGSRGMWRGLVQGNGNIRLRLMILRNGVVESTRYIGSVVQSEREKPTSFFFTAALPKGTDWSWSIVARAS